MDKTKLKKTSYEFIRYAIVGGIAFIVDIGMLFLCKEFFLKNVPYSLYIATAIGFFAGLVTNYLLCLKFVFLSAKGTKKGRNNKDRFIFVVIGVIGLLMTEYGMKLGVDVLSINYLIVKIMVTGIVLIWNYLGRKFFIFNVKPKTSANISSEDEDSQI
ncbi:MAG: GtrA family protein [Eubacteriales bacterium]